MKKLVLLGLSLGLGLGMVSGVFATPSTQIWIPSTDIQPYGKFHLGIDNYTTIAVKAVDGGQDFPTDFGLTVGILPWEKVQMEIGVDLFEPSEEPAYLNAKVGMPENAFFEYMPALAVGGFSFGTCLKGPAHNDYNLVYGLAAKTLPILGRFSAGYYSGNENLLYNANGKKDYDGSLLSWDRAMPEISDKLWLAIDHQGGSNAYGATSLGGSWSFAPNASILVGYVIFNDSDIFGVAGSNVNVNMWTTQFDVNF